MAILTGFSCLLEVWLLEDFSSEQEIVREVLTWRKNRDEEGMFTQPRRKPESVTSAQRGMLPLGYLAS